MPAWYRGTLAELLTLDVEAPTRALTTISAERGLAPTPESVSSWRLTATALVELAQFLSTHHPEALAWHYFMEFEVPMRARRIDLVLIADDTVFIVECKTGSQPFTNAARWQAEQYALDLRDFHAPSDQKMLVPVLVAYEARQPSTPAPDSTRWVQDVICVNAAGFADAILVAWESLHRPQAPSIDPDQWLEGAYKPTPNIIEAGQSLYANHDVQDIALAGSTNLHDTVDSVIGFIDQCRRERRRGIAFITGSPGAGKTLAGLEIAHAADLIANGQGLGLFLSGNWPLVEVISAAIAESASLAGRRTQRDANREVTTLIGHAYRFRNEYANKPERIPHHRVVLFDEAQRAWDGTQVARKERTESAMSEPAILMDIMGLCLIGLSLSQWSAAAKKSIQANPVSPNGGEHSSHRNTTGWCSRLRMCSAKTHRPPRDSSPRSPLGDHQSARRRTCISA